VAQQVHEATEQARLRQGGNARARHVEQQHIARTNKLSARATALCRSIGVRNSK
jgi:hypothetical protein